MIDRSARYGERTHLTWVRMTVALIACAMGAAGVALRTGTAVWTSVLFVAAALAGVVLLLRGRLRLRRVERALAGGRPLDIRWDIWLAWVGVLIVVVGALALVVALRR